MMVTQLARHTPVGAGFRGDLKKQSCGKDAPLRTKRCCVRVKKRTGQAIHCKAKVQRDNPWMLRCHRSPMTLVFVCFSSFAACVDFRRFLHLFAQPCLRLSRVSATGYGVMWEGGGGVEQGLRIFSGVSHDCQWQAPWHWLMPAGPGQSRRGPLALGNDGAGRPRPKPI